MARNDYELDYDERNPFVIGENVLRRKPLMIHRSAMLANSFHHLLLIPSLQDCKHLKPIYRGAASMQCPYCKSSFGPDMKKVSAMATLLICAKTELLAVNRVFAQHATCPK
jgi:hypothetical protein